MRGFKFLSLTVKAASLASVRGQINKISNASGSMMMMYGFNTGDAKFVLAVPNNKVNMVQNELRRLEGIAVMEAHTQDIQRFGQYQSGSVESEVEF